MPKTKSKNTPNKGTKMRNKGVMDGDGMTYRNVAAPVSGSVVYGRPRVPRINSTMRSTRVSNTEQIISFGLAASGAFNFQVFPLLPSNATWVGGISDLYSKWRWVKCDVIYIPKCPTSTSGSISMAFVYDQQDNTVTSRLQVTQCYQSLSFPPYAGYGGASALVSGNSVSGECIISKLDTSRLDKPWYPTIGIGAFNLLGTAVDRNIYCPASLVIASDGGPSAATPAGDFFLKYEVEFIEPINASINI